MASSPGSHWWRERERILKEGGDSQTGLWVGGVTMRSSSTQYTLEAAALVKQKWRGRQRKQ